MLAEPINANEVAVRRISHQDLYQVKQAASLLAGNSDQFHLIRQFQSGRGVTFIASEHLQSRSLAIVFHASRHRLRRDTPRKPLEDTRCTFFADHLALWSSLCDAVDEVFAEWMFQHQDSSILLTGYATGAALAMIEAARIKCCRQLGPDRLQVVTFGCPPLGSPTVLPELLPQSIHIACTYAHVDEGGKILYLLNSEFWDSRPNHANCPVLDRKDYIEACSEWDGQVRSQLVPQRKSILSEPVDASKDRDLIVQCVRVCNMTSSTMLNQECIRLVKLGNGSQIAFINSDAAFIIALSVDGRIESDIDPFSDSLVPWSDDYPKELVMEEVMELWKPLIDDIMHSTLLDWVKADPRKHVAVTGFGLGACLAGVTARLLEDRLGKTALKERLALVLFGCPPVWSSDFVRHCMIRIPRTYRIVYERDYLATVVSVSGREHLGKILHFRDSGLVCDDFWSVWRSPNKDHSDIERYRAQVLAWDGAIKRARKIRRKRRSIRKLIADDPNHPVLVDMAELSNLVYEDEPIIRSILSDIQATRPMRLVAFLTSDEDCEVGIFRYGIEGDDDCDLAIVFRGSSSVKDVYHDLSISPVPFEDIFEEGDDARVHQGFLTQFLSVRGQIDEIMNKYNLISRRIIVAGHSLGAANSILCSMHLEYNYDLNDRLIQIGFGGARVGNARFRQVFRSMVRNSYTVINDNDLVSGSLNFSVFGHVGKILHIRPTTNHLFDGVPPDWSPYSVADHSILNYIERLRKWSGRVISCPENEFIIRRPSAYQDSAPFTPFEILCTFAD